MTESRPARRPRRAERGPGGESGPGALSRQSRHPAHGVSPLSAAPRRSFRVALRAEQCLRPQCRRATPARAPGPPDEPQQGGGDGGASGRRAGLPSADRPGNQHVPSGVNDVPGPSADVRGQRGPAAIRASTVVLWWGVELSSTRGTNRNIYYVIYDTALAMALEGSREGRKQRGGGCRMPRRHAF